MNYYHVKIEDSVLPNSFTFDELIANGLLDERDERIQVKLVEENDWVIARDYPFSSVESSSNIYIMDINQNNKSMYTLNDDGSINRPGNYNRPSKPDNYLIWAIIGIFICMPFGILALVESVKVDPLYAEGDYLAAKRASDNTKKWSLWCLWGWLIFFAICIIAGIANS